MKDIQQMLPHAHVKLLVEVAVKDTPIPAHVDCVSAHHPISSCHIKTLHQNLHSHTPKPFQAYWYGHNVQSTYGESLE